MQNIPTRKIQSRLSVLVPALMLVATGLTGCYSGSNESSSVEDNASTNTAGNRTFDDAYWAALAQSYLPFVVEPEFGAAQEPEDLIIEGRWGPVIEWPEIATGAANLPDGRVVTWSSTGIENFGGGNTFTHASTFDPATGLFADNDNVVHNNFCAGVSMLPDGRPFAAGGGATVTTTSVYNSETNAWSLVDNMVLPRWYATSTTLPTGQVLTSLGTNAQPYSELWTPGDGWSLRTNLSLQSILDDNSAPGGQRFWFPAMNVAPDGTLFHPGPTSEMFSLDLSASDGFTSHGQRENGDPHRLYNTTVLYDVGKMLIAGGGTPALATAMTIDINSPAPIVAPTNSMSFPRSMHNSIVLPNGDVLVIGGNSSGVQFSDNGTQLVPELWTPDTGQWKNLAPQSVPRNYHSTALLLKDARVASMGGGLCGGCATNHRSGQIFEPPYLFNADGTEATRPTIDGTDLVADAGNSVTISGSANIDQFNMVRLVALTHHHTTDQRLIPLNFQTLANGSYQLDIPANPNVVIPGNYWIFALNSQGVPSAGRTIKINITEEIQQLALPNADSVSYEYFEGSWNKLPNFSSLAPLATGKLDNFVLTPALRQDNFGFRYSAKINAPQAGEYTFYTTSDDGSQLFINGQKVVDNDGLHGARELNGKVQLTAGEHDIVVTFFEKTGGQILAVSWAGPGLNKQNIATGLIGTPVEPIDPVDPLDPVDPPTTNLISNSTFEDNANDWATCSASAAIALTDDSFEGTGALQVAGCAYDEFPVTAGSRYKLECAAKSDGSAFTSLTLSYNDATYNELLSQSTEVVQTAFTTYAVDLVAPADSVSGAVVLYTETNGAQFDNCAVQEITDPTIPVDPPVDPVDPVDPPVDPIDPTAGNLVANSTFEQDANDWAACADGSVIAVTTDSFVGNGGLSVTGCAYDEFAVTAGERYTLTCAAKRGTASYSSVTLTYSDANYAQLDTSTQAIILTGYNNYLIELEAPANSTFAAVTLYSEAGDARYDECTVVNSTGEPATIPTEPITPPTGTNLLTNPDFETDLSGWNACQDNTSLQTSTDAASGNAAMAISGCAYSEFPVTAGKTYQLSCSAKGNSSDFANMTLSYSDSAFTSLSSADQVVTGANAYSTLTLEAVAPANSVTGTVDLYAEGTNSALFDDCGVIEVNPAP